MFGEDSESKEDYQGHGYVAGRLVAAGAIAIMCSPYPLIKFFCRNSDANPRNYGIPAVNFRDPNVVFDSNLERLFEK